MQQHEKYQLDSNRKRIIVTLKLHKKEKSPAKPQKKTLVHPRWAYLRPYTKQYI